MAKEMKLALVVNMVDKLSKPMQMAGKAVGAFSALGTKGLARVATQVENNKSKFSALTKPIRELSQQASRLNKSLNLGGSLKSLSSGIKSLSKAGAWIGASVGGVALLSQIAEKHEQLAQSVGLSGKSLAGWAGVASKGGFEADHVVDLIEEMNNKFGELESLGTMSSAEDSLKMLGLNFRQIRKLKPEEQFRTIMEAASKIKNQQKAVSAVDMLFGGEANKILGLFRSEMQKTGKTITQLVQEQQRYYLVTEEGAEGNRIFAQASRNLFETGRTALSEIIGILGQHVAPLLDRVSTLIISNMDTIRRYASIIGKAITVIFTGTKEEQEAFFAQFPVITDFFEKITKQMTILKFLGAGIVLAVITPLITSFANLGIAITQIAMPALIAIAKTLGVLTVSFIKLTATMLSNPIVLLIAAIVAAIAGLGYAIYTFRKELFEAWNSVVEFFKNIGTVIAEKIEWITGLLPAWLQDKLGLNASVSTNTTTTAKVEPLPSIKNTLERKENGKIEVEFKNAPKDMVLKEVKNEGKMALNANIGYNNSPIY